jgi:hypothetical protein
MYAGYMAMQGLATKVYMASAETTSTPATYMFMLGGKKFDEDKQNGTTSNSFLTFGRTPSSGAYRESYLLAADILLVTGELYQPSTPFRFDITSQFIMNYHTNIHIDLNISFNLPYVDGAIGVDDWDDDVIPLD